MNLSLKVKGLVLIQTRQDKLYYILASKSQILSQELVPDDTYSSLSTFKAFAEDKFSVTQNMKFVFHIDGKQWILRR